MKFRIMSDLHMEGREFTPKNLDIGEDFLVLAGDIHYGFYGMDIPKNDWGIHSEKIIFVPGNHEFYKSSHPDRLRSMRDYASHYKIKGLFDGSEVFDLGDDVVLTGGTLWTNFSYWWDRNASIEETWKCLYDYELIRDAEYRAITPSFTIGEFNRALSNIKKTLDSDVNKKVVVVTHHGPSEKSVHPRFADDPVTGGFVSKLDEFILAHPQIKLWVHGHTHNNFDYMIGGCRVVCNPRGYRFKSGDENPDFNEELLVEV